MLFSACSSDNAEDSTEDSVVEQSLPVSVLEPVQRDLAEIKRSGVLRMITYYSSNTYFLNQGIEVGFE